jgi:hypothetical protein
VRHKRRASAWVGVAELLREHWLPIALTLIAAAGWYEVLDANLSRRTLFP